MEKKNTTNQDPHYIIGSQVMEWTQDHIKYDLYPNFTRGPAKVLKDKKANCVDMAHFIGSILKCRYKIPIRFIYAEVAVQGRQDQHVWPQVKADQDWIDLDATSKNHKPGDTYNILNRHGVYEDLYIFGAPHLKKGCKI